MQFISKLMYNIHIYTVAFALLALQSLRRRSEAGLQWGFIPCLSQTAVNPALGEDCARYLLVWPLMTAGQVFSEFARVGVMPPSQVVW